MSSVSFENNVVKIESELNDAIIAFLYEIGGEMSSQTARNSRVATGQTKNSWTYTVNENKSDLSVSIGSSFENAIWEELGTGEYALDGNGRKGGWFYVDENGKGHFTMGKKPCRALWNAYQTYKPRLQSLMEQKLKGIN